MAQITAESGKDLSKAIARFAAGLEGSQCGEEMNPGLQDGGARQERTCW